MKIKSLCILLLLSLQVAAQQTFELHFTNFKSSEGYLALSIFSEKHKKTFLDKPENNEKYLYLPLEGQAELTVMIKDLPPGKYAVSAFHDKNSNKKLDTGFFGIPKEGFGFSKNPSIHFGAPDYEECEIDTSEKTKFDIVLKHF